MRRRSAGTFACAAAGWRRPRHGLPNRRSALRRAYVLPALGLCGAALHGGGRCLAAGAAAEPHPLPVRELSVLHERFGGDRSVTDNAPMPQTAPSGGTISALSVQLPALERLAPYLRTPGASIFDLGFGSGVMAAMMLAVAGRGASVTGVDLEDKVLIATDNLLGRSPSARACPFVPFPEESFTFIAGDAFEHLAQCEREGRQFDVMYAGCSMDPTTDQLRRFLGRLRPTGAAVFNLGLPGRQAMYFVADGGKEVELLMHVNFMMAESRLTPRVPPEERPPLEPKRLRAWIREHVAQERGAAEEF
eukprot:TRINITY_DN41758_c0_g1_i1.p1 TRINITY_DN41758_c0_g1~~TRINITY_DN41758_c0_g1_i1.p1  ORF type:complete len:334 (+),score=75.23 TRINITY_DN41758_c0_g1_i1:90-1004(+)